MSTRCFTLYMSDQTCHTSILPCNQVLCRLRPPLWVAGPRTVHRAADAWEACDSACQRGEESFCLVFAQKIITTVGPPDRINRIR